MESLFVAVKNIIIFLILITVILNLLGKSSFKQYINIFTGMILILIVIKPVLGWLNIDERMDFYFGQNEYKINMTDVGKDLSAAEGSQKKKIVEEYKKTISTQVQTVLEKNKLDAKKIEVEIVDDVQSENCGAVTSIAVVATIMGEKSNDAKVNVNEVDKITIDKIKINERSINEEEKTGPIDSYDTIQELTVKKAIAELFDVELEKISVEIQQ